MSACAPAAALRRYLDSALPPDEETAVAAHLTACAACRAVVDDLLRAPAPLAVPGYELLDEVGRGGMGVVFRARDAKLDRVVAVKVVHAGLLLAPGVAARLGDEAKVTAALGGHPGIIPVTDAGELPGGRAYFVMKFVDGTTFAAHLAAAARPLAADADLRVVERVARIAGYAHGLPGGARAHRDLKPSNVLLSKFDEVFVADWGLSKWCAPGGAAAAGGVTAAGHGTWAYMPPEQADPSPGRPIGAASDVFALGGILVEVLTGRPTYPAADAAVRAKAADLTETFARLAGCGADPELVALAGRCLSADPAARPADGTAVADALRAYFDGRAARLREAEFAAAVAGEKAAGARHRRRWQLAAAVAAVLAVAAVPVVYFAREATRLEREQKVTAEENAERFRARVVGSIAFLDTTLDRLRQSNSAATLRTVFDEFDRRVQEEVALLGDSQDLRYRRAVTLVKLSEASLELGDSTTARARATEAQGLYEQLAAADPTSADYQEGLAKACDQLVEVYEVRWEDDAKFEAAERSLAVRRALAERDPGNLSFQAGLAKSEAGLGIARNDLDDNASALPHFRSALARRERVFAARPDDPAARIALANSHRLLAYTNDQLAGADNYRLGDYAIAVARHTREAQRLLKAPQPTGHTRDWARARALLLGVEMWVDDSPAALGAARDLREFADAHIAREGSGYFWEQRKAHAETRIFMLAPPPGTPEERSRSAQSYWVRRKQQFEEWCRVDPANRQWRAGLVMMSAQAAGAHSRVGELETAGRVLDAVGTEAEQLLDPAWRRAAARNYASLHSRARQSLAKTQGEFDAAHALQFQNIREARAFYQRHAAREPSNRHWKLRLAETDGLEADEWVEVFKRDSSQYAAGLAAAAARYQATSQLSATDPFDAIAAAAHDEASGMYFGLLSLAGKPELADHLPDSAVALRSRAARVGADRVRALEALAARHPDATRILHALWDAEKAIVGQGRIEEMLTSAAGGGPFRAAFGNPEDYYLRRSGARAGHLTAIGNPFAPRSDSSVPNVNLIYYPDRGDLNARTVLGSAERLTRYKPSPSRRGEHLDALLTLMMRLRNSPGPERAWVAGRAVGLLATWDESRDLDPYLAWWRPHVVAEFATVRPRCTVTHLSADEQALHATFRYPELARRLVAADRATVLFDLLLADWTEAEAAGPDEEPWRAELMGVVTLDALAEPGVGLALLADAACVVVGDPGAMPSGFRQVLAFAAAGDGRNDLAAQLDPPGGYTMTDFQVKLEWCGNAASGLRNWPRARTLLAMWERAVPAEQRDRSAWYRLAVRVRYEDGEADAVLRAMRAANGADGLLQQRVFAEIERGGDLALARRELDATLRQLPDDLFFRSWHGWLLSREGKAAEGAAVLRGLRGEYPFSHDPVFAEHLADAEAAAGDMPAAIASYRRSIELFPATTAPTDHRLVGVRAKLAALEAKKP